MKFGIVSLGCRVNIAEKNSMIKMLIESGFTHVSFDEIADFYIIHTCSVTNAADSKSRHLIRKAKGINKSSKIVVTGCYAQVARDELKDMEEVDLIISMKDRKNLPEMLRGTFIGTQKSEFSELFIDLPQGNNDNTRAFIKIEEGCESFCSYCIIPYARGPIRSKFFIDTIEEVKKLSTLGYKELILTGIHTGKYGSDLKPKKTLSELLREIIKISGVERIRIGSLDPNEITDDFIDVFKNKKMMPHIHLSLQSGSNKILNRMNRDYTREDYYKIVNRLREVKDNLGVTTDIMVGFPGESDQDFEDTIDLIKKVSLSGGHIFKYSIRKGTVAALMKDQITDELKDYRSKKIHAVVKELKESFIKSQEGKVIEMLVEKNEEGEIFGYSSNYIPVVVNNLKHKKNDVVTVKIVDGSKLPIKGIEV